MGPLVVTTQGKVQLPEMLWRYKGYVNAHTRTNWKRNHEFSSCEPDWGGIWRVGAEATWCDHHPPPNHNTVTWLNLTAGQRSKGFTGKGWRHSFEKLLTSFLRQRKKWNASTKLLAVNDLLSVMENTTYMAGALVHLGARWRKLNILVWTKEVNLDLGLFELDQRLCSHVEPATELV